MSLLLAQIAGYSWIYLLKIAVVIAGCCMVVYLGLLWMGVTLPPRLLQILGVVAIVFVVLVALTALGQLL